MSERFYGEDELYDMQQHPQRTGNPHRTHEAV